MLEFSLDESSRVPYLNGFVEGGIDANSGAKLFRWKPYKDLGRDKVIFTRCDFSINRHRVIHYYDGEYLYVVQFDEKLRRAYGNDYSKSIPDFDYNTHKQYIENCPFFTAHYGPAFYIDYTNKKDIELTLEELDSIIVQLHVYLWELSLSYLSINTSVWNKGKTGTVRIDKLGIDILYDLSLNEFYTNRAFKNLSVAFNKGNEEMFLINHSQGYDEVLDTLDDYKKVYDLGLPRLLFRYNRHSIGRVEEDNKKSGLFESFSESLSCANTHSRIKFGGKYSELYTIIKAMHDDSDVTPQTDDCYNIKSDKLKELKEYFDNNKDSAFVLCDTGSNTYVRVLQEDAYKKRLEEFLRISINLIGYNEFNTDRFFRRFSFVALYDNRDTPLINRWIESNNITKEDCVKGLDFFKSDLIHDIIKHGTDRYTDIICYVVFFVVGIVYKLLLENDMDMEKVKAISDSIYIKQ